jgi:hypothetical protein
MAWPRPARIVYLADGVWACAMSTSRPRPPARGGSLDTAGYHGVAVDAGRAYVADGTRAGIVDVTTPAAPVQLAVLDTEGHAWNAAAAGAGLRGGFLARLRIVDVTRRRPHRDRRLLMRGFAAAVARRDSLVAVADLEHGLRLLCWQRRLRR